MQENVPQSSLKRNIILAIVVAAIVVAIFYLNSHNAAHNDAPAGSDVIVSTSTVHTANYAQLAAQYPEAKEITNPAGFINTPGDMPITVSSLIGKKVILLDFWAYSCINCQRTIPYLNAWYQKYKDEGLEIIGIHTPEFDFEKQYDNVQAAVTQFGIQYPVVLDNGYSTWDSYQNEYWPEEYLIDINGLVVDRNIGEGNYAATEKEIQTLLAERKQVLGESGTIDQSIVNINETVNAQSPETYFGSARNEYLGNGVQNTPGVQNLTLPTSISGNTLYLGGKWNFEDQYAENTEAGAKIEFQYDAQNVYFVASSTTGVNITVLRDGVPVGAEAGSDVGADGTVNVKAPRLYHLVSETQAGTHTLELIVNNPGLDAFTFTFG